MTPHVPDRVIEEWSNKPFSLVFLTVLTLAVVGLAANQVQADNKLQDFEKKFLKIERVLDKASHKANTNGDLLESLIRLAISERIVQLRAEECEGDSSKRTEIETLQEEYRKVNNDERYPEPDCR